MLVYLRDGFDETILSWDQTFYLTQSQYTDIGPTSPTADPTAPGVWQGTNFKVTGLTRPGKRSNGASGNLTQVCCSPGGRLYHEAKRAVERQTDKYTVRHVDRWTDTQTHIHTDR